MVRLGEVREGACGGAGIDADGGVSGSGVVREEGGVRPVTFTDGDEVGAATRAKRLSNLRTHLDHRANYGV